MTKTKRISGMVLGILFIGLCVSDGVLERGSCLSMRSFL